MKKTLLLGLLSLVIGISLLAQPVPNGGFEDWIENELSGYEEPSGWQTPNPYTAALSIFTTTKSTDFVWGQYSVKLESKNVGGFVTPGVITLGDFTVDFINNTAVLSGGIPFTSKPLALLGTWKNYPVEGDHTMIMVYFTKYSPTKGKTDTIGMGTMLGTETIDTWTNFSVPIEYFGAVDPDTMNLHVISSNMLDLKEGSYMLVDNLAFEYEAGINDYEEIVETSVFPNPASDRLSFTFAKEVNAELKVFSNDGQAVYTSSVRGAGHQIDVSNLAAGTYYYNLFEKSKTISSGQFVISR